MSYMVPKSPFFRDRRIFLKIGMSKNGDFFRFARLSFLVGGEVHREYETTDS